MITQLEEDNYLRIQLLSYDKPTIHTERFYFLEMSTLQATTLLAPHIKILTSNILAYTDDNKYLDENTTKNLKCIGDFNDFFLSNPYFYIHQCNIELENGIKLSSHDDGEVSIEILNDKSDVNIVDAIFEKYKLDKCLIDKLKSKPGHYITIDKQNNITGDFKNFDDYLENGRE